MIRSKTVLLVALMAAVAFTACNKSGGSGKNFTDVMKVEDWLAKQKGGASPDDPIPFSVKINLQNMASPESNWQKLLTSINTAGLYVALDLSGCTMPGTEFDTDGGIKTGKQFIVSLILPDSAESFTGDLYIHFSNLETAKSKNIDNFIRIGYASPAGGIVFYDKGEYSDGWRYLEAAPADMATELRWVAESYGYNYDSFPDITGTETGIGSGKRNTELILAKDPNAPAAKACKDLNIGGKTDWYLPSKDELNLMYKNLKAKGLGGFKLGYEGGYGLIYDSDYWSSSQYSTHSAWFQIFYIDGQHYIDKTGTYAVRAVRAF